MKRKFSSTQFSNTIFSPTQIVSSIEFLNTLDFINQSPSVKSEDSRTRAGSSRPSTDNSGYSTDSSTSVVSTRFPNTPAEFSMDDAKIIVIPEKELEPFSLKNSIIKTLFLAIYDLELQICTEERFLEGWLSWFTSIQDAHRQLQSKLQQRELASSTNLRNRIKNLQKYRPRIFATY